MITDFPYVLKNLYGSFEGEPEIIFFRLDNQASIHLWDGIIVDMMSFFNFEEFKWIGLTRDWQEDIHAFEKGEYNIPYDDLDEYIEDLLQYQNCKFKFKETPESYQTILEFFLWAKKDKQDIIMIYSI